jgi:hypothetical protein
MEKVRTFYLSYTMFSELRSRLRRALQILLSYQGLLAFRTGQAHHNAAFPVCLSPLLEAPCSHEIGSSAGRHKRVAPSKRKGVNIRL